MSANQCSEKSATSGGVKRFRKGYRVLALPMKLRVPSARHLLRAENSVTDLIPLLDAHARRLGDEPFLTLDELVGQVGETAELCVALAFSLVGKERVYQASKDAIGKMVTAYALISHVRRLSIDASHQRLGIPLDLMLTHDIDPHDVFGGVVRPGFSAAVGGILNHAGALYEGSRAEFFPGDVEPLALLLPTSLTPLYLRKLGQSGFSLFQHSSEIPAFRRQMRYLRVQWQKRF